MKAITFVLFSILLAMQASAQEQTLISGQIESGGFGGPEISFSQIDGHFGILVGGYGGWYINHTFMIGGGGYGLVNDITAPLAARTFYNAGNDLRINFGYGGLVLEYVGLSDNLVHYSISTLIGAGGVGYGYRNNYSNNWNDNSPTSAVFVLEPKIGVELNVTPFFRIGGGGSYRLVRGSNLVGIEDSDLSDGSLYLAFKFGKF